MSKIEVLSVENEEGNYISRNWGYVSKHMEQLFHKRKCGIEIKMIKMLFKHDRHCWMFLFFGPQLESAELLPV